MGGSVTVVVKTKYLSVNMCRWTNSLPYYFSLASLWQGNELSWTKIYLKEWLKMKNCLKKI